MAKTVRTTLALPEELLAAADRVVRAGGARSRNELVAEALRNELRARTRREIDESFAGMEDDAEYQHEAELIMREFEQADWEAWKEAETEYASSGARSTTRGSIRSKARSKGAPVPSSS